jgi:hypothetical protein
MKKILLLCGIAFFICHSAFSQEREKVETEATNEIKVNLLTTLLSFPEISYERIWGNNIGVGISAGVALGNTFESNMKYRILPYGRFYFGETSVKSFFVEGSMAITGYKDYYYNGFSSDYSSKTNANFGLGVSIGYKYTNRKGFIGELLLGVGRTFNNNGVFGRFGIVVGKQF